MRGTRAVWAGLIWLAVLAAVAQAAGKGWKPILLERVSVGGADLIQGPGGRPLLAVAIANKSAQPVWVALGVRSTAPIQAVHLALAAHQDTVVKCALNQVAADVDYVISATVFPDSSERDTLETGSASARFSTTDVAALEAWLRAGALPKTFKHIDKVNNVMMKPSSTPHVDGTLVVDSVKVSYDAKKDPVTIQASALRAVRVTPDAQPWVIVDYDEGGEVRTVSFRPPKGGPLADEIAIAIRSAMSGAAPRK